MEYALATLVLGIILGLLMGYTLGRWRHAQAVLDAYRAASEDAHKRALAERALSGGPCWVKAQLPPGST